MTMTSDPEPSVLDPEGPAAPTGAVPVDVLYDISLQLTIELGRVTLPIREVLRLGPGSVIDLGRSVGEPVDLLANEKLIARGELVVVDSALAVRITEIAAPSPDSR